MNRIIYIHVEIGFIHVQFIIGRGGLGLAALVVGEEVHLADHHRPLVIGRRGDSVLILGGAAHKVDWELDGAGGFHGFKLASA